MLSYNKSLIKRIVVALVILTAIFGTYKFFARKETAKAPTPSWIGYSFADKGERLTSFKVAPGRIFANIATAFGFKYPEMLEIMNAAKPAYDLQKIIAGHEVSVISRDISGEVGKLLYQIDNDRALLLEKNSGGWSGKIILIPYETTVSEANGTINTSLFSAVTKSGGDEKLALALAEMFAWQIDFTADIRGGDSFKVVYEKRFLNGNYVSPGRILAAKFVNDNKEFRGVYFKNGDGKEGYYDESGNSLEKIFLKSPLAYKYISSGFSYNRLNPVTKIWRAHRAIDYAANYGTPVVTVGDGTVIYSDWRGEFGIAVFVRHNGTYTTVYGHLSRPAVRAGAKVKQGQIIGYVGATGQATGPHLHFELRKNGGYVNPLTIELPPGDPITQKDREAFALTVAKFKNFLAE